MAPSLFSRRILVALLLLLSAASTASARPMPDGDFGVLDTAALDTDRRQPAELLESAEAGGARGGDSLAAERPELYLIVAEAEAGEEDAETAAAPSKRSAAEASGRRRHHQAAEVGDEDDLETAAGTNVLRPLFVYRQQLAYRERVKKGALRRVGIRPRF